MVYFGPPNERVRSRVMARKPDLVKEVLRRTFKKFGIDKQLERYQFVMHWKEIVGPEISKRAFPMSRRGKALVIRVSDSAWAQELSFHKQTILKRLQRFVPHEDPIEEIIFSVQR